MHIYQHLEDFWRFVFAALVLTNQGELTSTVWTDQKGQIVLPGTGIYFQTRPQCVHQRLQMRIADGQATTWYTEDAGEVPVELTRCHIPLLSTGIELNAVDQDLHLPGRTSFDYEELESEATAKWQQMLNDAWQLIRQTSPAFAQEIVLGIQAFVPVRSTSPLIHLSGSFHEAPGLVTISWHSDVFVIAEAIVHEYHHQKLNALLDIDPLIIGPTAEPIYYSPWRSDPRPLTGLLHAAYTFQAILTFCNQVLASQTPLLDQERIQRRTYEISRQVHVGITSLQEYARFSPLGKALIAAMARNFDQQSARLPQLPEEIRQQVHDTQAQHRQQWEQQNPELLRRIALVTSMGTPAGNPLETSHSEVQTKEQEVLNWLHLPLNLDGTSLLGQQAPSDILLSVAREASHEGRLAELNTLLEHVQPGDSLLLDILIGHVAYIQNEYERAATFYRSCLEYDLATPYFWRCYAFALRHLGQWDEALFMLTNLERLSLKHSDKKPTTIEQRLQQVRLANPVPPVSDGPHRDPSLVSTTDKETSTQLSGFLKASPLQKFLAFAPTGAQLPTFLATLHGLKPAMDLWVPYHGWEAFEELVTLLGLHYFVDTYFDRYAREVQAIPYTQLTTTRAALSCTFQPHTEAHVFVARTQEALHSAIAAGWYPLVVEGAIVEKHLADHDKFGAALGYPECCQTFFLQRNNWHYDNTYYAAYLNTATSPQALSNGFLRHTAFGLVPHMACSFACEATMRYASQLRTLIEAEFPAYAQEIDRHLRSPLLCLSELRIYCFEGDLLAPQSLQYSKVETVHPTRQDDAIYQLLIQGDRCVIDVNIVRIYKQNHFIGAYMARADHHGPEFPFFLRCG